MRGLTEKVMVVAGAATGIGAETSRRLASEGASVIVGDINIEGAETTAQDIRDKGGTAEARFVDLADEDSVAALIGATVDAHGGLDGLHLNAADLSGATTAGDLDAVEVDLNSWERTLLVNLRGHLLGVRHAIPHLLERGGGTIVCTSSAASFVGEPTRVAYAASKAGINSLIRHVASRWGKEGVRANAVAPAVILAEAVRDNPAAAELMELALTQVRSHRLGEPADIAAMVAFLMSDDAAWINGQVLSVDGGATLR